MRQLEQGFMSNMVLECGVESGWECETDRTRFHE